jgi:hypothetical protein
VATLIPTLDSSLDDLKNRADKALFLAKGRGKNRVVSTEELHLGQETYQKQKMAKEAVDCTKTGRAKLFIGQ